MVSKTLFVEKLQIRFNFQYFQKKEKTQAINLRFLCFNEFFLENFVAHLRYLLKAAKQCVGHFYFVAA